MYSNNFMLDKLNRYKDEIDNMIRNQQSNPINNFISTNQTPNKELIEWRILNENEEVDNLYVQNKTLFISDNLMVLKGVDGKLEKWEVKKIYPIDKKDQKINELEEEIKKLKEVLNEHSKSNGTIRKCNKPNDNVDGDAQSKPETNVELISGQE